MKNLLKTMRQVLLALVFSITTLPATCVGFSIYVTISPEYALTSESVTITCQVPQEESGSGLKAPYWYRRLKDRTEEQVGYGSHISNPKYTDRFSAGKAKLRHDGHTFYLNISYPPLEDAGEYGCAFTGKNAVYRNLTVTDHCYGSAISVAISTEHALMSESITMTCKIPPRQFAAVDFKGPYWYRRLKDGYEEQVGYGRHISNPKYSQRFTAGMAKLRSGLFASNLNISGVQPSDSGEYGCGLTPNNITYQNFIVIDVISHQATPRAEGVKSRGGKNTAGTLLLTIGIAFKSWLQPD